MAVLKSCGITAINGRDQQLSFKLLTVVFNSVDS